MRIGIRAAVLTLVAWASIVPQSHATCGSAACFLETGTREGLQRKGVFHVDFSFQYIDQSRKLEGSDSVDEVLTPKIDFENMVIEPDHHREISTQNTLVGATFVYGVTGRVAVYLVLPLVNDRAHEHWDDVGTPDEFYTNSDGSSGFGDVKVGARYGLYIKNKDIVVGDLALSLPTGAYELLDSTGEINEPTIQPGTGAYGLIPKVRWSRQIRPDKLDTFVSLSWRLNAENDLNYQIGSETVANIGFLDRLDARWSWLLELNTRYTGRDEYLGQPVPSTGSTLVNLTPGVRFTTPAQTNFYLFVQIPVWQDVNEAQLAPTWGMELGVSRDF